MSAEVIEKQAERIADVIMGLIKTCRASQIGFLNAAERVRNSALRSYFIGQSMERARFAAELERVAHQGEIDLSRGAPTANRVQRVWTDLRLVRGSDGNVLSAVALAERNTRDLYQQALSLDLPPNVHAVLERQAESISDSYDQVSTLRDMRGKAA
jgi:uncharacterized protein (TIGR02284 family)